MPESPYFLLMKNNKQAAHAVLEKLRGHDNVYEEVKQIHEAVKNENKGTSSKLDLFTVRSNRRAVIIAFGIRLFQQLSGIMAITFYARTIFNEADAVISSKHSTILYFAVQVVVSLISTVLVDRVGRRPLLIVSMLGSGITLAVEAIYFYLKVRNQNLTISPRALTLYLKCTAQYSDVKCKRKVHIDLILSNKFQS